MKIIGKLWTFEYNMALFCAGMEDIMDAIARQQKSLNQDEVEFVYERSDTHSRGMVHYYKPEAVPAHKGVVALFCILDEFERITKETIKFIKE